MGFPRGPILDRSGKLRRAATRKNIWDVVSAVGREGVDMLRLRTEYLDQLVKYAYFHQFGAGVRRGRMITNISGRIGQSGKFRPYPGIKIGSGFNIIRREANPINEETRTFRLPPRPFLNLDVTEEMEIYGIFAAFMMEKVNDHWGPDTEGRQFS